VPPPSFFLVSAVFHYLGPSLAVLLFARIDVLGVAWFRIASAAVVFAAWRRPWRLAARLDRDQLRTLLALGVVLAAMNTCFYLAIARLPLSTVGSIEFLGTVVLAAAGTRTRRNVAIRLTGQPLGFVLAFGNCVLFIGIAASSTPGEYSDLNEVVLGVRPLWQPNHRNGRPHQISNTKSCPTSCIPTVMTI
jgi:inner membrane transporter RhtA